MSVTVVTLPYSRCNIYSQQYNMLLETPSCVVMICVVFILHGRTVSIAIILHDLLKLSVYYGHFTHPLPPQTLELEASRSVWSMTSMWLLWCPFQYHPLILLQQDLRQEILK